MQSILESVANGRRARIGGVPESYAALILGALARAGRDVLFVAADDVRATTALEGLRFFAPDAVCLPLPAWDCLPYDRASPHADIVSRRIDTLTRLIGESEPGRGRLVVATASSVTQRLPPRAGFEGASMVLRPGQGAGRDALLEFLVRNGYRRVETVREAGEFAVRGGIVDLFATGDEEPVRLDYFGDDLESLRRFDAVSQRTSRIRDEALLRPVSEVPLDEAAITRFRTAYRARFGVTGADDPLFTAVSEGRRHVGMEHWLPLYHPCLETVFDYLADAVIVFGHRAEEALLARRDLIGEYYIARQNMASAGAAQGPVYRPVPPESLFLGEQEWERHLDGRPSLALSPFDETEGPGTLHAGVRAARDFADVRVQPDVNLYDAVREHIAELRAGAGRAIIAAHTEGSRDRLGHLLREHGAAGLTTADDWAAVGNLEAGAVALCVVGIERGFEADDLAVITEEDILGDRLTRRTGRRVRPENVIAEASSLLTGDLVVHMEHGIGRYDGLVTLDVAGAPHDCLRLTYDGGDKLYVPVENIELLSRYGSEEAGAALDRLGGAAWQARKARLKERIREMAHELIAVAAQRSLRSAAPLTPADGLFDEFCARFPYAETDDQQRAIDDTLEDLSTGRPMDRLICGDVGFGKTEVALRAAFIAVMAGRQVAVIVPTTLLARQHYQTFVERFANYPVRIAQLSRLVPPRDAKLTKHDLTNGTMDIVIGTHALLSKSIKFRDLGLMVVDEEQHFGVAHKERLKQFRADVHVLTLTATPIPRTLQMALAGVRELSLIATPPVDRLAVRTFVLPYDPVVIREAIIREHLRGGQTFYVCPRIEHMDRVVERVRTLVPEVKVAVAHGRMASRALEKTITAFYEGAFDVLVSTNIIESGLDLPAVNTIVVHRADMFGLSQLYQLRGRVGRSKVRAYAYLSLPPGQKLTPAAEKRLEVMQTLDSLGAGFSLASHDLDIRGAGNLLGEEQSGHIREVGIELYQQMLEEAVTEARGGPEDEARGWSPQINLGTPVLIPEDYVQDLGLRLELYRRLSRLEVEADIDAFAAEMVDRFGALPPAVENLLETVTIKQLCLRAGVEKVEAGPKGAVLAFRGDSFANPVGLVGFISDQVGTAKLRPDHRLVFMRDWETPADRLTAVRRLMTTIAEIAGGPI